MSIVQVFKASLLEVKSTYIQWTIFSNNAVPGEKKAAMCTTGSCMRTINQRHAWREIINKVWTDGKCQ